MQVNDSFYKTVFETSIVFLDRVLNGLFDVNYLSGSNRYSRYTWFSIWSKWKNILLSTRPLRFNMFEFEYLSACFKATPYISGAPDNRHARPPVLSLPLFHRIALDVPRLGAISRTKTRSRSYSITFIINRHAANFATTPPPRLDGKMSPENTMTINSHLHYLRRRLSDARSGSTITVIYVKMSSRDDGLR